jgi:uncharacterized protein
MIIAISGAGGFIGKSLGKFFIAEGFEVRSIGRISRLTTTVEITTLLEGANLVINLAGAPIIGRWTKTYKQNLYESRIVTTSKIVEAIKLMAVKPGLLISASAVGIYSQEGSNSETNFQLANDYLGEICKAWEKEAEKAIPDTRVIITRFGIVLGKQGGALEKMLPLFKLGLGGKIASGKQGFSWIHIDDVVNAINSLIGNTDLSGVFNFTSPGLTDNKNYTRVLSRVLKRPAFFTVPLFALNILFGEGSIAVAGGQFAPPNHLLNAGYSFRFPDLEGALMDITS